MFNVSIRSSERAFTVFLPDDRDRYLATASHHATHWRPHVPYFDHIAGTHRSMQQNNLSATDGGEDDDHGNGFVVVQKVHLRTAAVAPPRTATYLLSMSKYSLSSGGNDPFSTLRENKTSACSTLNVLSSVSFMSSLARKLLPRGRRWVSYSRRHATYRSCATSTRAASSRHGRSTNNKRNSSQYNTTPPGPRRPGTVTMRTTKRTRVSIIQPHPGPVVQARSLWEQQKELESV